jgi:hypothetical protein
VGSADLPDQPDGPERARRARDCNAGAPPTRDLPDPDERTKAYEATRAHVSAEAAREASPGPRPDEGTQRSYRDEAPQLLKTEADQDRRSAGERPADRSAGERQADRSADPPIPDRRGGDLQPTRGQDAEITAAIGRVRETEPTISSDMQGIERENRYGGWLEGFDRRLKDEDRLKEKIAERLEGEPDKTPTEILRAVPDAIRYTFCFRPETYTQGYYDIKERLESCGYQMYESRNSWDGAEYKGINTRCVTPEGQRFEVQFHTPESFYVKQYVTHGAYERIRNPLVSDEERAELKAFQRDAVSRIQIPDGATDIPDFKKKGF